MERTIEDIRQEIDAADDELMNLIQRRFELAREIGVLKNRDNLDTFNPSRETAIVERLAPRLKPPFTRPMLEAIFAEIFSISRSLQKKTKVAYLGPEGSYSHQATRTIFNLDAELMPKKDIETVINEVLAQRADLGVVPVENSTEGMINRTLDMMATSRLFVCREILLPIRNCLLSCTTMDRIRKVYSHPQALAQCRKWIMDNLPLAETVETASTSIAALTARAEDGSAAIASSIAAEIYGLDILAGNINDIQENITRFWVI
ncbi:prephenate dehydratase, partial [archaeon]|nr:prephenate dehydratase [archaeon]